MTENLENFDNRDGNSLNKKMLELKSHSNFEVTDRNSFIDFIGLMRKDFLSNPVGWENNNLGDFLAAIERYTEDIQGYYDNRNQEINADEPSWRTFADIFKGAKMYE